MIAFDAAASSGAFAGNTSYSHTCTGSNLILILSMTFVDASKGNTSAPTYNGMAMTQAATFTGNSKVEIWYLVNPATGTHSVALQTSTISVGSNPATAQTVSLTGAAQTSPIGGSGTATHPNTNSVSASVTTTVANSWIVDSAWNGANSGSGAMTATGTNQTRRNSTTYTIGGNPYGAAQSTTTTTTTGSYAVSYSTVLGSNDLLAVEILPLAAQATASVSIMNASSRKATVVAGSIPMFAPIITIRQKTSPFRIITQALNYIKTSLLGTVLPVLNNESSDSIYLRIYNDFQGLPNIADAINVWVTTWDGNSHTASMAVASQQWLHIMQTGFGEGSSGGALFTQYPGIDRAVGGPSTNGYFFDYASDGTPNVSQIKSASNFYGAGFIELKTYIFPSLGSVGQLNNFVISVSYEYVI